MTQGMQQKMQQFQSEFSQLGQDLQSGNISAAQSDLTALLQYAPQSASTASSTAGTSSSTNTISQEFNQLSQDLQSNNLAAAQQDYSTIQQDFQNQSAQSQSVQGHHHHHHHEGGGSDSSSSAISQLFNELGSALQSGNLSNAQQAYSSLQQDLLQFTGNSGLSSSATSPTSSSSGSLSVNG
jgi:hypothetical protein